jgi:hypothetical protein
MGNEANPYSVLKQGAYNLTRYFGALPFIRCREGFVEQNKGIRKNGIGNLAHPPEFLVEFAAFH